MKSQGETTKKVDKIVKVTKDFISSGIGLKKLKSISSIDDYDVIVKNKVQNKTYLIDSSLLGGSGIQTIAEGTNITVDATDPLNPIISATDSASTLFPNGVKLVMSSRDFQANDKDYILYCPIPSTVLTMPTTNPFSEGDYIGVVMSSPDSYFETYNDGVGGTDKIYPYTQNPSGTTLEQQSSSEVVILRATNVGIVKLLPLCGAVKTSVDINGSNFKTLARYNYDYSQNAIPLSGTATLSSGTVTVTTDKIKTGYKIYVSVNTPSGTQGFLSAPTGSIVDETEFVINSTSATDDSTVNWWIAP